MRSLFAALVLFGALAVACSNVSDRPPSDDGTDQGEGGAPSGSGGQADLGGQGGEGAGPAMGGAGSQEACQGVVCPDPGQECVDVSGSARCQCRQGEDCAPVDECAATPCAENASCTDLADGFRCDCLSLYSGNGFVCASGDPCQGVTCDGANEICRPVGDVGECGCKSGYSESGGECLDIDECANASACDANAACQNLPGGFRCACNVGFATVGTQCVDIDECGAGTAGCDADHGECTDGQDGGYACACAADSFGDGFFCKKKDDCDHDPCQNGGVCSNTPSGYRCACPLGTTGEDCADTTSCATTLAVNGDTPLISDPVLLAAVERAVGGAPGTPITVADLAGLHQLAVPSASGVVASLDGLECLAELEVLALQGQPVTDLSPLAGLPLRSLDLSCSSVEDLGPVSNMVQLEELSLINSVVCPSAAQLDTVGALEDLTGLVRLRLVGHQIDDLSPLAGLRRLVELDLSSNAVADLDPVRELRALASLSINDNPIGEFAPLADLTQLKELRMVKTSASSLAVLSENAELLVVVASENSLAGDGGLSGLFNVQVLELADNDLTELTEIAKLERLSSLLLSGNPFTSLDELVAVPAFGQRGVLQLGSTQLSCPNEEANIATLESRGLTVIGGCP